MALAVDSTFVIDHLKEDHGAGAIVARLAAVREAPLVPTMVAIEVLEGAYFMGGERLKKALAFLDRSVLVNLSPEVAHTAGRLGAELLRRGLRASAPDLVVAATALQQHATLVTRDTAFSNIPGLTLETY